MSEAISIEEHAEAMTAYMAEGVELGQRLGNRGPVEMNSKGRLTTEILDQYWEHGFYIFENVIRQEELDKLRREIGEMIDRAPTGPDATVDRNGDPAFGLGFARKPYTFVRPLSDPWGGTKLLGGRHPHQMLQPTPQSNAPEFTVYLMHGMCQLLDSGLELYGHPALLGIAASINGEDFVPFNDAIFVKQPGLGGSVAWHQDGVTHWDNPDWDIGIHGFNFQVQLYPSTPRNCLWVIPGTHHQGRADIRAMIAANGGSERLPGAVPLTCNAGDVTIANRQVLHGSFANTSDDLRVSVTFGFHRYRSVLGARAGLSQEEQGVVYDDERIWARASVIQVAIDARAQAYPDEARFDYGPFADRVDELRYSPDTFDRVIRDYNLKDLAI